jgi:hypothetical protein
MFQLSGRHLWGMLYLHKSKNADMHLLLGCWCVASFRVARSCPGWTVMAIRPVVAEL